VAEPLSFDPIAEARRQWRTHWGDGPTVSMVAVTSIMRAEQILMARLNTMLKPWRLTFPRYETLMVLYYSRTGSLPMGKLGRRLQVHPTSVTNTVDGLERLGFVSRERHDRDRRTTMATITDAGRRTAEEATALLNAERFGTVPLTRRELDSLADVLARLRLGAGDFVG
jgi:DNA-binding MarR family transcriptional regulator